MRSHLTAKHKALPQHTSYQITLDGTLGQMGAN